MSTYLLSADDGLEHIVTILSEEPDFYSVETTHRFRQYEVSTRRNYNKCLFEKLLRLGIIRKLSN